MLKLKLQYFGYLPWRADSLEKMLKTGEEGDSRGCNGWMASLTHWSWVWANCGWQWRTGNPGGLQSMVLQRVGHDVAKSCDWHLGVDGSPWNMEFSIFHIFKFARRFFCMQQCGENWCHDFQRWYRHNSIPHAGKTAPIFSDVKNSYLFYVIKSVLRFRSWK